MKPHRAVSKESRRLRRAFTQLGRYSYEGSIDKRPLATASIARSDTSAESVASPPRDDANQVQNINLRAREKHVDRNLLLDVLSSTSSKREARSYLSRFDSPTSSPKQKEQSMLETAKENKQRKTCGVNLGGLYPTTRAIDESPVFAQKLAAKEFVDVDTEAIHVALVMIRSPQELDDLSLQGIGLTLRQLAKLGLSCVVVVDQTGAQNIKRCAKDSLQWRMNALEQADRVVSGIDSHGRPGARRLDSVIGISSLQTSQSPSIKVFGNLRIIHPSLLFTPLRRGITLVIAPVGYNSLDQAIAPVRGEDVVLALTREFTGIARGRIPKEITNNDGEGVGIAQKKVSLDRLIILDKHGGIPSLNRSNGSHIFINLEQEYEDISQELSTLHHLKFGIEPENVANGNPIVSCMADSEASKSLHRPNLSGSHKDTHLDTLQLVRDTLALLPPSSSALLTTPSQAANSTHHLDPSARPGVGTRPQRNPLIHNLLTDKPVYSSSLPPTRLSPPTTTYPTTFIKRGMPLTILPDPRISPWTSPTPSSQTLQLSDPRLDLPRLIHLIEDSFSRELDVQHYLSRIQHSLAGIIIAGAYEGGAILTWESPPNLPPSLKPSTPAHTARLVPYLDKFAVLKRSQGAGGVADIVFSAMVRECFPQGVVWRSRRDNPVNKWYFERARGTWKIPVQSGEQGWTMFWTTEGVEGERFGDYEGVCRGVGTSWADGRVLD